MKSKSYSTKFSFNLYFKLKINVSNTMIIVELSKAIARKLK
jgi:hypothetical protein